VWFDSKFRRKQTELFISALQVRKQFLLENKKSLKGAANILQNEKTNKTKDNKEELFFESWKWINFAIPVISTTFASFHRMFQNLQLSNSVPRLFIDEAGQALPQAGVGALLRSKRVMAVGDPSQIPPVLTLDSKLLEKIRKRFKVSEKYISAKASIQTLIDSAGKFSYFKQTEKEWIGLPLWVHRRCKTPMFTISNEIS
jgi:superfamily I DNA and/or RNA helicase